MSDAGMMVMAGRVTMSRISMASASGNEEAMIPRAGEMAALAMMVSNEMDRMAALSMEDLLWFANVFSPLYLKLIAFADRLRPCFFKMVPWKQFSKPVYQTFQKFGPRQGRRRRF